MLLSAQEKYLRDHRDDFRLPWRDLAACRGIDTEMFFSDAAADQNLAKSVCAGCPSVTECRQWAIDAHEKSGVWGGTTPAERTRIVQRRSTAA